MFYPPEGLCAAEPERGPIVFTYVFLCRKGSQFTGGFLTLKMFYPPEGLCGAEPERGPIVFTLHFIGVGRGTGGFKMRPEIGLFENLKMFYLMGRVGRTDGEQKCPLKIFILCGYIDKVYTYLYRI